MEEGIGHATTDHERVHHRFRFWPDAVWGKPYTAPEDSGERLHQPLQRECGVLSARPTEMREHDNPRTAIGEFLQGDRGPLYARHVGDATFLHRHIEIDAHQ